MKIWMGVLLITLLLSTACGGDTEPTPTPKPTTNMRIINYSHYPTSDIEKWVDLAESKMKSRESRIFAFIYPVGKLKEPEKRIRSDYADRVFREHHVLLSKDKIEFILNEIDLWFEGDLCLTSRRKKQALSDYKIWLEKGADASTQHSVCERTRVVMMAVPERMRDHEPLENFQTFLVHEFYHAFQQDLEMEGECLSKREKAGENSNSVWMYEGGAHYFATWVVAEIYGETNYRSEILRIASDRYSSEGNSIILNEPDKWGAAALSLMIEQGMVNEESILDGSLFHNCARELEFDYNSPDIKHIKNTWHLIERNGDIYQFKSEALRKASKS